MLTHCGIQVIFSFFEAERVTNAGTFVRQINTPCLSEFLGRKNDTETLEFGILA